MKKNDGKQSYEERLRTPIYCLSIGFLLLWFYENIVKGY